jgi:hypothetical protein
VASCCARNQQDENSESCTGSCHQPGREDKH